MKPLLEMTQKLDHSDDLEALIKATQGIPGCIFAYGRKGTAGHGEPNMVISLHETVDDTVCLGQRRAVMLDTDVEKLSALPEAVSIIGSCSALTWSSDRHRTTADKWHVKAVEFLKRIGAW